MWGRGTVLGGRYTLSERIGGGAMGDVWKADDSVLARQVAVKVLLPALLDDEMFARRFRREASVLAALRHPGIVDIHDYGENSGEDGPRVAYIVMELIDGRPLNDFLTANGPAPAETVLDIAAQALEALHAAHLQGIVHRDIKPANLMLRDDGRLTVTDFGIARAMAATTITASHSVLGTALYVAPEQAEGKLVTGASDLYAMGVVCYEMLTGQVPFTGETVLEVVLKHVRDPAPDLPDTFPQPVRDFVAVALAKDPEHRFPDALAMATAARAIAAGTPATIPLRPATTLKAPKASKAEQAADTAETRPQRVRRRLLVPLIIPCVITAGAGTALLVDRAPFQADAKAGSSPSVSVSASVPGPTTGSNGGSGTPTTANSPGGSTAPSSPAAGTPAPGYTVIVGGGNGAPNPPQTGGANGGTNGGGSGTGTGSGGSGTGTGSGSGSGGGSGSGNGGSTPGGGGAPVNSPAPTHSSSPVNQPVPGPARPANCGGDGWGSIVNVGDGLKVGLASDSPGADVPVVMGGHTEFGWVHSHPDSWHQFHACNLGDPAIGWSYYGGDGIQLIAGGAGVVSLTIETTNVSGAVYIKDYLGQSCLTDNGAGNRLTMNTCTPGNTAQEWRTP
ncbi:protein kinase domain-containing protein [Kitasatospora sp. McL0602]|uniref:protein kinase domain-containing protein n=1 Tax=Kitasatospora sp. McL0602 TaxID=3439530 RepID=UPI003F8CDD2B